MEKHRKHQYMDIMAAIRDVCSKIDYADLADGNTDDRENYDGHRLRVIHRIVELDEFCHSALIEELYNAIESDALR